MGKPLYIINKEGEDPFDSNKFRNFLEHYFRGEHLQETFNPLDNIEITREVYILVGNIRLDVSYKCGYTEVNFSSEDEKGIEGLMKKFQKLVKESKRRKNGADS